MNGNLRAHLITMADLLDHNPEHPADEAFTTGDRVTLANDITGGNRDFLDLIPRVNEPTTRGVYAARLRQIAGAR